MTLTISRGERPFIDILQDRCFLYGLIKSIYSGPCLGVAYISLSVYLYLSFFVAIDLSRSSSRSSSNGSITLVQEILPLIALRTRNEPYLFHKIYGN